MYTTQSPFDVLCAQGVHDTFALAITSNWDEDYGYKSFV